MEQQWCGKIRYQSNHKRVSIWINILVSRSLRPELLAGHWTFFKLWDAKCMNIRGAKFSTFKVVTTVPNLLLLCSILFCSILRTY
jgi:hypothetical protein